MMMTTVHLRADDEATLAAALPQLRGVDLDGAVGWLVSGRFHAFDPIGALALELPVLDPDSGEVVTPAVVDERWHANLLFDPAYPDAEAILAACEPFIIQPEHPRRIFA